LLAFIEAQPWGKHTAIIVSADHGEAFGEHKMSRHGFELWEPLVRVPLLLRVPGVAPRQIDTPRSHLDLAPTIFELMDVPRHDGFGGRSLVSELKGEQDASLRDVILDLPRTSHNFRRRALVRGRYKLIAYGDDFRYKLLDIVDDPAELRDLRGRKRDVYKDMKRRYLQRVKQIKDICPKMRHKLKGKRPERRC
jgi:arylsulfatase A-like enzyme